MEGSFNAMKQQKQRPHLKLVDLSPCTVEESLGLFEDELEMLTPGVCFPLPRRAVLIRRFSIRGRTQGYSSNWIASNKEQHHF